MPDFEMHGLVRVHCLGCEDDFHAVPGSAADTEKLCGACATGRDDKPEQGE